MERKEKKIVISIRTFQIFFYALRPGFIRSQRPTIYHLLNALLILTTDYLLVHFFGWKPLLYLLFSSFFAGSLHPCAAHFIAEHYLLKDMTQDGVEIGEDIMGLRELAKETTSYYGWLNVLCYNVSDEDGLVLWYCDGLNAESSWWRGTILSSSSSPT
jgi:sphingolipid 4-desaturase/C4-monooxygenase